MTDPTVSQMPSDDIIHDRAKEIGAMIFQVATWQERQPIYEYGRCLLANIEPPASYTLHFYRALTVLAPRLPAYQTFTRDHTLYAAAISRLQCRIAVHVARCESLSVVLK